MKRALIILSVVVLYVIGIWYALVNLPFVDTPELLKSLFAKSWHGSLVWIKIRHTVAVVIIGGLLSMLLVKYDNKTAQIDALIIGALSILYGVIFKLVMLYGLQTGGASIFTWIDVTDYLVIGSAIPALVAIICRVRNRAQPPSDQPLEPIR